jgi:hypothetical protein
MQFRGINEDKSRLAVMAFDVLYPKVAATQKAGQIQVGCLKRWKDILRLVHHIFILTFISFIKRA